MDERTRRLGEESVGKLLWAFSLPAVAGMLVGSLYNVINRAFLGHVVGADAIAGLTVCMPISFIIMAFGMLVGVGSGALVSIRLGQKKLEEAELILGNSLTLLFGLAVALTAVFWIFLEPLLLAFGASANTLAYAQQFMRIILLGSFAQYVCFGLNAVIRAEGNPRLAMLTMLITAGLNVGLDAVFILGLGWGMTGAAIATVISLMVGAAWTLLHFCSRRSILKLRRRNLRLQGRIVLPAVAIGMAPFAMHIGASAVSLLMNRGLAEHGGDAAVSAYGIINVLTMLLLMPLFGLNQGAQPIIGYNFGAGRIDRARATLKLAITVASIVSLAGFAFIEIAPSLLLRGFTSDSSLVALGARGFRISVAMLPVVGFQVVSSNFFQAVGKAKTALVLGLLRQVIVLIPLIVVLPRLFGLDGMWAALPAADAVASLLTAAMLYRELTNLAAQANDDVKVLGGGPALAATSGT